MSLSSASRSAYFQAINNLEKTIDGRFKVSDGHEVATAEQIEPVVSDRYVGVLASTQAVVSVLSGVNAALVDAGWVNASDPHVVKIGNRWVMFFSAISLSTSKLNVLQAHLPDYAPLSSLDWTLDGAIISPGGSGAWDEGACETAHYIKVGSVERIYYMGWESPVRHQHIGAATWNGTSWVKEAANPLITPTHPDEITGGEIEANGDVSVFHDGERYIAYYQSLVPNSTIVTMKAECTNGLVFPVELRSRVTLNFPTAPSNLPDGPYFIHVVRRLGESYFFGWVFSTDGKSGLWLANEGGQWREVLLESEASPPFDADELPAHTQGYFGCCVAEEGREKYLFFHAVRNPGSGNLASIFRTTLSQEWFVDF